MSANINVGLLIHITSHMLNGVITGCFGYSSTT